MLKIAIRLNPLSLHPNKDIKSDPKQALLEQLPLHSSLPVSLTPVKNSPTLWNVPEQNKNFIPTSSLDSLEKAFKNSSVVVCHGSAGMGKTALAVQFVYQNYKNYTLTAWFNATNVDELLSDYHRLGEYLNLPCRKKNDLQTRWFQVKRHLSAYDGSLLLVFDNVQAYNGPDGINEWILSPSTDRNILITSRLSEAPYKPIVQIEKFSLNESIKYAQKILDPHFLQKNEKPIETLAKSLNSTLAFALAILYINTAQIEVSDYLKLYKKKALEIDSAVYIHWSIAMEKILEESKLAFNCLTVFSYLANEISDFLFKAFADEHRFLNPNKESHEKAEKILKSYSMLTINEQNKSWSMNSSLKEAIRISVKQKECEEEIVINTAKILEKCFLELKQTEDRRKISQLFTHFETLLPFLKTISVTEFHARKVLLNHYLRYQAEIYEILGNPYKQIEILKELLSTQRKELLKYDIDKAKTWVSLGNTHDALGQSDKTKTSLKRAFSILDKQIGNDNVETTKTFVTIANSCESLGEREKTKHLLEKSLPILEKHYHKALLILKTQGSKALSILETYYGEKGVEIAKYLTDLGNAYGILGNHQKKKAFLKRALSILEMQYGKKHVEVAKVLAHLGNTYGILGNYQKKKHCLESALSILETHYGKEHVEIMTVLINLTSTYDALKEFSKQKRLLERVLPILDKIYDEESVPFITAHINLRNAYAALGDFHEQEALLEKRKKNLLDILKKNYSNGVELIKTLLILGDTHGALGDFEKQKQLQEQALFMQKGRILNNEYEKTHMRIELARTMLKLQNAYGALKNFDQQKQLLEEAFSILVQHFPKDAPELIKTILTLRNLYSYVTIDFYNQKKFLHKAVPILESYFGKGHFEVAITWQNLGNVYGALSNYYKQTQYLELALPVLENHYGPNDVKIGILKANLTNAYCKMNRDFLNYTQRRLLKEAIFILYNHHGSTRHIQVAQAILNLKQMKKRRPSLQRQMAYMLCR